MNRSLSVFVIAAFLSSAPVTASANPLSGASAPRSMPFISYPQYGYPGAGNNACAWHTIDSPNKNTTGSNYQNSLVAVEASSSSDAWADGYYANSSGAHSLLEHWTSGAWSLVTAPAPSGGTSEALNGIGASSPTDVWAVGTYFDISANLSHNLIMHYNGATWSIVSSPNVANGNQGLRGISAVNPNDAWAIGESTDATSSDATPLLLHWNGVKWAIVPGYNLGEPYSVLVGVAAYGPNNVYTLGDWATDTGGSILKPQGAHFDTTWTLETTNSMGSASSPLNAQAANSATDMWGIGDWYDGSNFQTLAEHWNGSKWKIFASPDNGGPEGSGDNTVLFGAAAVNSDDVWGVGLYYDGVRWQTYTMQWTGAAWATVPSPDFDGANKYYTQLNGASKIPGTTDVWAVGFHGATLNSNNTVPNKTYVMQFQC